LITGKPVEIALPAKIKALNSRRKLQPAPMKSRLPFPSLSELQTENLSHHLSPRSGIAAARAFYSENRGKSPAGP
jgi:hypothetical protein